MRTSLFVRKQQQQKDVEVRNFFTNIINIFISSFSFYSLLLFSISSFFYYSVSSVNKSKKAENERERERKRKKVVLIFHV